MFLYPNFFECFPNYKQFRIFDWNQRKHSQASNVPSSYFLRSAKVIPMWFPSFTHDQLRERIDFPKENSSTLTSSNNSHSMSPFTSEVTIKVKLKIIAKFRIVFIIFALIIVKGLVFDYAFHSIILRFYNNSVCGNERRIWRAGSTLISLRIEQICRLRSVMSLTVQKWNVPFNLTRRLRKFSRWSHSFS